MIKSGNLDVEMMNHPERRGWFFGHFIDKKDDFHSNTFEIKWGSHKKGEYKQGLGINETASTLAILVRGKAVFTVDNKDYALEKAGDYVYWSSGIPHTYKAVEDFTTVTIRWPSIAGDQK